MADSGSGALAGASLIMTLMGSIGTAYAQSQAQEAEGAYRGAIADSNAKIADLQGDQAREAGDIAASRSALKTKQTIGAIRAAQAGSGTDVNSGSNALVRVGIDLAGHLDELQIRNNAARAAWGFKTQAIMDTASGQFARLTGSSQAQQTLLNGGMQAVTGAIGMESNYLRWSRYMGGGGGSTGVPFDTTTGNSNVRPVPTPLPPAPSNITG